MRKTKKQDVFRLTDAESISIFSFLGKGYYTTIISNSTHKNRSRNTCKYFSMKDMLNSSFNDAYLSPFDSSFKNVDKKARRWYN